MPKIGFYAVIRKRLFIYKSVKYILFDVYLKKTEKINIYIRKIVIPSNYTKRSTLWEQYGE